jgi:enediyne polyketide synthase
MAENSSGMPEARIAVVGMACRFPEAASTAEFWDLVVTGRRAFRRLPPVRLDPAEYSGEGPGSPGPSGLAPDVLTRIRAALIEGWRFDRAAFGVTQAAYRAADPAHWLALETAASALADAGFPGGQGLTRDRTGVIIGNTLTGEVSRAIAMRSRWPYVRRVLRAALAAAEVPKRHQAAVIDHAAGAFLSRFPDVGEASLAGALPGAIADRICGHFGFRGASHAVDAAHASSLVAVASACSALAAGDLDAAVAGGVDISLDPFELAALAATGALACDQMRVYDARPTGFWPGEGCGLVVLLRACDARAAGLPCYAEIAGWGMSSAGNPALARPGSASLLLALRRAYRRAGVDPADVQFIEGDGTGTASGDLAELTSLAEIRQGAAGLAALGSVKANIGHAKAAAGAASLIKATLAVAAGVIPPATGCARPHPLIASGEARLRVPRDAEPWPGRARLAGVSSVGPGGTSVHLVLARGRGRGRRQRLAAAPAGGTTTPPETEVFAFSGGDRERLAWELARVSELAPWLSEGEFHDLACQAGRGPDAPGPVRAALVASDPGQLGRLARDAAELLPGLAAGKVATVPGLFAADGAQGRVTLLFPGEGSGGYDPARQPAIVAASLAGLRWLEQLGVTAVAGAGHGLGELTGLVWAGCLTEAEVSRLVSGRAEVLAGAAAGEAALVCVDADEAAARRWCREGGLAISAYHGPRSHVLAGPATAVRDLARRLAEEGIPACVLDCAHGLYSPSMAGPAAALRSVLAQVSFRPPARRLFSTITGSELAADTDLKALLGTHLTSPVRFSEALARAGAGADLLVETGPGGELARLAAGCCEVPVVSLAAGPGDAGCAAVVAAGLFAAGAVDSLRPLFVARAARPIDIWRERVFIANPCGAAAPRGTLAAAPARQPGAASEPRPTAEALRPAAPACPGSAQPPTGKPATRPEGTGEPPQTGTRAAFAGDEGPLGAPGIGPWARCFTEQLRPLPDPPPQTAGPWRRRTAGGQALRALAERAFPDSPDAPAVLVVAGELVTAQTCAVLLDAAREAAAAGRLVVVTPEPGLAGFCASLAAEHPGLGVTLLRAEPTPAGLRAARRFATAEPGCVRELVVTEDGRAAEVVMAPADPAADGTFPLGPADVVLASGITSPGDLACAAALASRGAALAVIAAPGPEDPRLAGCLAELRAAGRRVGRKKADLADPGQVAAAVRSLERGLGPVTAVVHAVAPGLAESCARLSGATLRNHLASQQARLSHVLAACAPELLRVLVTFSSLTARYGRAGAACEALAGGLLAEHARRATANYPRCRRLHVDWAPWEEDQSPSPGTAPIPVAEGSRLLQDLLTSTATPSRVAVHGRVAAASEPAPGARRGVPASQPSPGPGRFLRQVRVYYPGTELVADARLCLETDPYLADYRIDGLPVFPAAMALEAMAQAACVLAGSPQRHLAGFTESAPVVVPGPAGQGTVIRVCALAEGDRVRTVLRCSETGFRLDHVQAVFSRPPAGAAAAGPPAAAAAPGSLRATPPAAGGIVDGTDLYGAVYFQSGRFRRVAFLPETGSRACRALVRGGDTQPWFAGVPGPLDMPLVLGSPGLNDATLHVVQACLPHRRLLPAGCESATFSGHPVHGAVAVHARRRFPEAAAGGPAAAARPGGVWDITAVDGTGEPVVAWTGVRMTDVGPLAPPAAWHPALFGSLLEARISELGIDGSPQAVVSSGPRDSRSPGTSLRVAPSSPALPWSDVAAGQGPLDGFELTVRATRRVACRWEPVGGAPAEGPPAGSTAAELHRQLERLPLSEPAGVAARLRTILACLAALGCPEPQSVHTQPLDSGWLAIRAPGVTVASALTRLCGVPVPVAVAVAGLLSEAGTPALPAPAASDPAAQPEPAGCGDHRPAPQ